MFAVSVNTFQPHTWRHTVSIPRPLLSIAIALAATSASLQAEVIYFEEFPGDGNGAGSAAGWDLSSAQNDAVFFGTLYGGFNAAATSTGSVAYLTDATSDDGSSGDAFTPLVQSEYDSIDFSFTYTNSESGATDVEAIRLAVEVDGQLYASTTTAAPSGSGAASTYSLTFNPMAANWLLVTAGTGEVTIGTAATSDLLGDITSVGIVQTNSGNGVTSFDKFQIDVERAAPVPEPGSALFAGGACLLLWRRRRASRQI